MAEEMLISLETALELDRFKTRELYKQYVNPGLVGIMSLIGFDKQYVRAEGAFVWDAEGNQYLDFLGGYGALNLGHNPERVWFAVNKVRERPNILQAALNQLAGALAANIAYLAPGDLERTFFCNSGAEAVEGALKLAKAYDRARNKIIYAQNSFHGKSIGALSVTGRDKYRRPFYPLLSDCIEIPFGDADALENALKNEAAAALILEPIQGEGGVNVPPIGYLKQARALCEKYKTLLIVDEIQTGFGRTGTIFACEHEKVEPDILCIAKSLGGGVMPVGAYITTKKIWDSVYGGLDNYAIHTSTFGGNSLAMAAGLAAISEIVEKNLAEEAAKKGEYMMDRLRSLPDKRNLIKDIRGKGLLIGIEFNQPSGGLMDKISSGSISKISNEYLGSLVAGELLNKYRIITAYTLNNPNVVRLEPPLIVSYKDIDLVVEAIGSIMEKGIGGVLFNSVSSVVKSVFLRK